MTHLTSRTKQMIELLISSSICITAQEYVCFLHLQLLLKQGDFSDACLSGLIGLFNLSPLSRQAKPDILQFALQLGLLIILEIGNKDEREY